MKALILAGGRGTRLSEETVSKPKPLVEVAGYPRSLIYTRVYFRMEEGNIQIFGQLSTKLNSE